MLIFIVLIANKKKFMQKEVHSLIPFKFRWKAEEEEHFW